MKYTLGFFTMRERGGIREILERTKKWKKKWESLTLPQYRNIVDI
jgi:hypothetical protein